MEEKRLMENKGRYEIKHYINKSDFIQLRSRLPTVMRRDEHSTGINGYRVKSLYFDNYLDKALLEKIDGVNEREKFRLRLYNENKSFIRLEKKSKKSDICYKVSSSISLEQIDDILNGNFRSLSNSGDELMLEFYTKMQNQLLRPKSIVDYRREAFAFEPGNVRITLDYDIRTSLNAREFLNSDYVSLPISNVIILEVKYDNFLPEIIRGITTLTSRKQTAFSKYAAVRVL